LGLSRYSISKPNTCDQLHRLNITLDSYYQQAHSESSSPSSTYPLRLTYQLTRRIPNTLLHIIFSPSIRTSPSPLHLYLPHCLSQHCRSRQGQAKTPNILPTQTSNPTVILEPTSSRAMFAYPCSRCARSPLFLETTGGVDGTFSLNLAGLGLGRGRGAGVWNICWVLVMMVDRFELSGGV
jgi:hypothetical protein